MTPEASRGRFDSDQPLHPKARELLLAAFDAGWGDPARHSAEAARARGLLAGAKESVSARLGIRPDELFFVGESDLAPMLAISGALASRGGTLLVSAVERSEILAIAANRESRTLAVDSYARVKLEVLAERLAEGAGLVSIQRANGEVGTIQPLDEAIEICTGYEVPMHVDLGVGAGRLPLPAGWSYASADARNWCGPAGLGIFAVRTGARWQYPWPTTRERHEVGTYSLPLALAAAAALEAWTEEEERESDRIRLLVERIRMAASQVENVEVVGDPLNRVSNIVTFSALYCDGEALIEEFAREGFAVGSGSACTSDQLKPSHVLAAMGALTHGNVRVWLPHSASDAEIDQFCKVIPAAIANVRNRISR